MTDNEIIKAYEDLTPLQQLNLFRNLYYNDGDATERGIIANAINDILTQYHRQKAEIEEKSNRLRAILPIVAELKSEAIKEFAEVAKNELYHLPTMSDEDGEYDYVCIESLESCINNLAKEMTEGV